MLCVHVGLSHRHRPLPDVPGYSHHGPEVAGVSQLRQFRAVCSWTSTGTSSVACYLPPPPLNFSFHLSLLAAANCRSWLRTCACVRACVLCLCISVCLCMYVCAYLCVCLSVYIYMCVCVCVCCVFLSVLDGFTVSFRIERFRPKPQRPSRYHRPTRKKEERKPCIDEQVDRKNNDISLIPTSPDGF